MKASEGDKHGDKRHADGVILTLLAQGLSQIEVVALLQVLGDLEFPDYPSMTPRRSSFARNQGWPGTLPARRTNKLSLIK